MKLPPLQDSIIMGALILLALLMALAIEEIFGPVEYETEIEYHPMLRQPMNEEAPRTGGEWVL